MDVDFVNAKLILYPAATVPACGTVISGFPCIAPTPHNTTSRFPIAYPSLTWVFSWGAGLAAVDNAQLPLYLVVVWFGGLRLRLYKGVFPTYPSPVYSTNHCLSRGISITKGTTHSTYLQSSAEKTRTQCELWRTSGSVPIHGSKIGTQHPPAGHLASGPKSL